MRSDHMPAYPALYALLKMQPQIDSQHNLSNEHEHKPASERCVDIGRELATAVCVAEKVSDDGEDDAKCLERNMPS